MITAKVILNTRSKTGKNITTMEFTYPRFIHAELMTHRVFSRNAASSRAIPIKKMIWSVVNNPAMPVKWGRNKAGMQADDDLSAARCFLCRRIWLASRWFAIAAVWLMHCIGLHKQVANRLLEPWMHMTVVVTSTEWANFFCLRAHKDAQPEFQLLAYRALHAYVNSVPVEADYHFPYLPDSFENLTGWTMDDAACASVANCARVSYTNQGVVKTQLEDRKLHDRLLEAGHMSPFEHVAYALADPHAHSGNFVGWKQYRKTLPNECRQAEAGRLRRILCGRPSWITLT